MFPWLFVNNTNYQKITFLTTKRWKKNTGNYRNILGLLGSESSQKNEGMGEEKFVRKYHRENDKKLRWFTSNFSAKTIIICENLKGTGERQWKKNRENTSHFAGLWGKFKSEQKEGKEDFYFDLIG